MIGFIAENDRKNDAECEKSTVMKNQEPVKSIVDVRFNKGTVLSYYNDKFNLKVGDSVFVEGKFEGQKGTVVSVVTHFKIKLNYYKRVIAQINLEFHGEFKKFGGTMISFDCEAPDFEQVRSWMIAPPKETDDVVVGDEYEFPLDEFEKNEFVNELSLNRGIDYLNDGHLIYFSIRGAKCRAIVQGKMFYEVEFEYKDGIVKNLTCNCFRADFCKHEATVLFYLTAVLRKIEELYFDEFVEKKCLTAVQSELFFNTIYSNGCTVKL